MTIEELLPRVKLGCLLNCLQNFDELVTLQLQKQEIINKNRKVCFICLKILDYFSEYETLIHECNYYFCNFLIIYLAIMDISNINDVIENGKNPNQ